jgi:hypothetical protein
VKWVLLWFKLGSGKLHGAPAVLLDSVAGLGLRRNQHGMTAALQGMAAQFDGQGGSFYRGKLQRDPQELLGRVYLQFMPSIVGLR